MPDKSKDDMRQLVMRLVIDIQWPADDMFDQRDVMYYSLVKCYKNEEDMDN